MNLRNLDLIIVVFAVFGMAVSCSNQSVDSFDQEVTFKFKLMIDQDELVYDEFIYENDSGEKFSISKLHFLISDLRLKKHPKDDDGVFLHASQDNPFGADVVLADTLFIDGGDPSNMSASGVWDLRARSFTHLDFYFGLAGEKNSTASLENIQKYNKMAWPNQMGGGYHYMKFEGKYLKDEKEKSFLIHTGPLGGADFSVFNRISLDRELLISDSEIVVPVNIANWLRSPNQYSFFEHPGMIMGNSETQEMLQENGKDVFPKELIGGSIGG